MKRMTFLTALALVFSLFTVTAAIAAGPGPVDGHGSRAGEMVTTQARTQTQTQADACQAAECQAGEIVPTQTRTQAKTRSMSARRLTRDPSASGWLCRIRFGNDSWNDSQP